MDRTEDTPLKKMLIAGNERSPKTNLGVDDEPTSGPDVPPASRASAKVRRAVTMDAQGKGAIVERAVKQGMRRINSETRAEQAARPVMPNVIVEEPVVLNRGGRIPREIERELPPPIPSDPRPDLPKDPIERLAARQRERDYSLQRKANTGSTFQRYRR